MKSQLRNFGTKFSKEQIYLLLFAVIFFLLSLETSAQTSKDIQGTWRMISTTITNANGDVIAKVDSSTHNLTKVITAGRIMFTSFDRKTGNLQVSGHGKATTKGSQYIETFELSTAQGLLKQPMVFTYKIQGNKLSYEGGAKDLHIVEVLQRLE